MHVKHDIKLLSYNDGFIKINFCGKNLKKVDRSFDMQKTDLEQKVSTRLSLRSPGQTAHDTRARLST